MDATPLASTDGVQAYCYPLRNALQYRYARFSSSQISPTYDTTVFQIQVGISTFDTNRLANLKAPRSNLYNFVFGLDGQGGNKVDFANTSIHFVALDGSLTDSSTWIADQTTGTTAMVFAHYDQYVPDPNSSQLSYHDVIVVKYHRPTDPPSNYTLRFYARSIGLILEKTVVGSSTVIAALELVAIGDPLPN
jgi:hypothetical protein